MLAERTTIVDRHRDAAAGLVRGAEKERVGVVGGHVVGLDALAEVVQVHPGGCAGGGAGIAVGPLLATGAQEVAGWASAYWLEALLAVVLGVIARLLLDESRAERPRPVDVPGVVLLAAGVGVLLTGLVEARSGPTRPLVIVLVLAGLALLGVWLWVEHRRAAPMIDPELFRVDVPSTALRGGAPSESERTKLSIAVGPAG